VTFAEYQHEAWDNAEQKGWHSEPRSFGDEIALIHSEVSEALEEFREHGHEPDTGLGGKPLGTMSELADVVIRVMDTAENLHRNGAVTQTLAEAITQKLAYNRTRPYRHGGKRL
jgi:hypothetical protein